MLVGQSPLNPFPCSNVVMATPAKKNSTPDSRPVWSTTDRVELLNGREKDSWKDLKESLDTLKSLMSKVKTDGVRKNVDHAISYFNKIFKFRPELHAEVRAKISVADRDSKAVGRKITDYVEALETKVLRVLNQMSAKIKDQDRTLAKLVTFPVPNLDSQSQLTEAVKKGRRKNLTTATKLSVTPKDAPVNPTTTARLPRSRPLALMVKNNGDDFPVEDRKIEGRSGNHR